MPPATKVGALSEARVRPSVFLCPYSLIGNPMTEVEPTGFV